VWIGLIVAAIVLIALLIFIGENSRDVTVHFLGAHGRVPLAVALLLSAVAGLLIAAIPGTVRILQLRRSVKQNATTR
jgi:putative membrane protein